MRHVPPNKVHQMRKSKTDTTRLVAATIPTAANTTSSTSSMFTVTITPTPYTITTA